MSETIISPPAPAPAPAPVPSPSPAPGPSPAPSPSPSPAPAPAPAESANWREQFIGKLDDSADADTKKEHEATLKMLERITDPKALIKVTRDLQKKVSSGTLKTPLPKNATEEQLKAWRAENGIPESPDKYELKLGDGVVLGADDKPYVDEFVKVMHGFNAPPDVVSAAVKWDLERQEKMVIAVQRANDAAAKEVRVALTEEWGAKDFQDNADGIQSMLSSAGQEVLDLFSSARGPDDIALLNNPAVLKALSGFARELGYVGSTVVPGGGNALQSLEAERDGILKTMADKPDEYYGSEKMQKRLQSLNDAIGRQNKNAR